MQTNKPNFKKTLLRILLVTAAILLIAAIAERDATGVGLSIVMLLLVLVGDWLEKNPGKTDDYEVVPFREYVEDAPVSEPKAETFSGVLLNTEDVGGESDDFLKQLRAWHAKNNPEG